VVVSRPQVGHDGLDRFTQPCFTEIAEKKGSEEFIDATAVGMAKSFAGVVFVDSKFAGHVSKKMLGG
jgi:hypothetical protein